MVFFFAHKWYFFQWREFSEKPLVDLAEVPQDHRIGQPLAGIDGVLVSPWLRGSVVVFAHPLRGKSPGAPRQQLPEV